MCAIHRKSSVGSAYISLSDHEHVIETGPPESKSMRIISGQHETYSRGCLESAVSPGEGGSCTEIRALNERRHDGACRGRNPFRGYGRTSARRHRSATRATAKARQDDKSFVYTPGDGIYPSATIEEDVIQHRNNGVTSRKKNFRHPVRNVRNFHPCLHHVSWKFCNKKTLQMTLVSLSGLEGDDAVEGVGKQ